MCSQRALEIFTQEAKLVVVHHEFNAVNLQRLRILSPNKQKTSQFDPDRRGPKT